MLDVITRDYKFLADRVYERSLEANDFTVD